MGQFPYECKLCGGGYKRCGNMDGTRRIDFNRCKGCGNDSEDEYYQCEGGQFCWEETCVVVYEGKPIHGFYDAYGRVMVEIPMNDEDIKKYAAQIIEKRLKSTRKRD